MKITIKELADELGISKTAINKKVTANQKRKHFSKIGNKFMIDEDGQKLIKSMFRTVVDDKSKTKSPNIDFEVSDLVSVLNNRIISTERQLQEKDKQLSAMQKLLDQQQVLTLQANQKILTLETSLEEKDPYMHASKETKKSTSEQTDEAIQPLPKKKGFFSRWFN